MKKLLLVLVAILTLGMGAGFASFPVKLTEKKVQATEQNSIAQQNSDQQVQVAEKIATDKKSALSSSHKGDDLLITVLLWFFLGFLAGHRWYKGKPVGWNILFILTAGGFGIWWIVDLINILSGNF